MNEKIEKAINNGPVVHPQNLRGRSMMRCPVAIAIQGIGNVCYVELSFLPSEIIHMVEELSFKLERDIERKQRQLERLNEALHSK